MTSIPSIKSVGSGLAAKKCVLVVFQNGNELLKAWLNCERGLSVESELHPHETKG